MTNFTKLWVMLELQGPYSMPPSPSRYPAGGRRYRDPLELRRETAPGTLTHLSHPSYPLPTTACMPPLLRRTTPTCSPAELGTPTFKPGVLIWPNCALQRTGPLVTPGEIYHWSPLIDFGFGRIASDFQGLNGSLPPRYREPRLRPQRGHPADPLYPTEGTRCSGRGMGQNCKK